MALITCPSCGRLISDQAQSCPQCGHPVQAAKNVYVTNPKKGKGKMLVGTILLILSILMSIGNAGHPVNTSTNTFIGFLFLIGLILLIYGKIEHWWHWK